VRLGLDGARWGVPPPVALGRTARAREVEARERVSEAIELVGASAYAERPIGQLSGGEQQRLLIAQALVRRPRLLLLDEPATGLDPPGMRDMRRLIRRLAGEGITVLLSSHLLGEVDELCNRVAILRRGRVAYEGALGELRSAAGAEYRLRTTDDERARAVCAAQRGIEDVAASGDGAGLRFRAQAEAAVGELSLALAESGALVLELSPRHATLEDLFFSLTEGEEQAALVEAA
jgi:ABC-2 type transport system ATP-binding protein